MINYHVIVFLKLSRAMVYEEEDFQPMQYGYHLNPDISEQRIIGMLREVEEDYHRRTRAKQLEAEQIVGIYARIKFCRVLYQAFTMLLQRKEDQQPAIVDCQRLLTAAQDMLFVMQKTVDMGVTADENCKLFILTYISVTICLHMYVHIYVFKLKMTGY